jgi:hypothetical protein
VVLVINKNDVELYFYFFCVARHPTIAVAADRRNNATLIRLRQGLYLSFRLFFVQKRVGARLLVGVNHRARRSAIRTCPWMAGKLEQLLERPSRPQPKGGAGLASSDLQAGVI